MAISRKHLLWCLSLIVACSQNNSSDLVRSQSQVLLDEPPDVTLAGSFQASDTTNWNYFAKSNTNVIIFTSRTSDDEETLSVPASGVLGVLQRTVGTTNYFVVSTVTATDTFRLYRYHDSDGDGAPDAATQALLLDSGQEPMYVTHMSPSGGPDFFLLDGRCQDVLLARDTNADGWPDSLLATPFAMADDYPDLKHAEDLIKDALPGIVHAVIGALTLGGSVERELRVVLTDGNGDGVADSGVLTEPATVAPYVLGALYEGQTDVFVLGEAAKTVVLYRLDQQGMPTIQIGSHTFASGDAETVTLTSALILDEPIQIRFAAPGAPTVFKLVGPKTPQIIQLTPRIWRFDEGATINAFGQNFTTNMTVKLVTAADNVYTLSYTYTDSNNVTLVVPPLTLEADIGSGMILGCDPGQTTPGFGGGCALCESAAVVQGR